MSDCRIGVSPVNYPDPDPEPAHPDSSLIGAFVVCCLDSIISLVSIS